jgi:putative ATP-dependent endonuclease of OLD family
MHIEKVIVENFKSFKGRFQINLESGINILVGNNGCGKSTILEGIHLALSGLIRGKSIKNDLSEYLFNNETVREYIESLSHYQTPKAPPHVLIEIYWDKDSLPELKGDGNSSKENAPGVYLKIEFDESFNSEYSEFIKKSPIKSLPIEYYKVSWGTFAREIGITTRSIPFKSALIDSSETKFQNGSDLYISRIIRDRMTPEQFVDVSQEHRLMKDTFDTSSAIKNINQSLNEGISDNIQLSVDLSPRNSWENTLIVCLNEIPFHYIGKGDQAIIKTKLALGHKKAVNADLILLEEPENHLSFSKLNALIDSIDQGPDGKQFLISTHSSFVANKLGLDRLILLSKGKQLRLKSLPGDTPKFFKKLAGFDTLRMLLCKKAILVEGDSDELVVQKAYSIRNNGKIPLQDGIDIISVGTSFIRFLEIAKSLELDVVVVTDNDGSVKSLENKYEAFLGQNSNPKIKICFDNIEDTFETIGVSDTPKRNYNTLEPKILKLNSLDNLNQILSKKFGTKDEALVYMAANKTETALKLFESNIQEAQEKVEKPKIDVITPLEQLISPTAGSQGKLDFEKFVSPTPKENSAGTKIPFNFPSYILEAIS